MVRSDHRPTVAHIHLENIAENLKTLTADLPQETKIMAVVKANAYGHGAVPVAQFLEDQVDLFCLSNLDEALELRAAGITKPLLILGVVPIEAVPLAITADIALTLASQEWLEQLLALHVDLTGLSFHLKVDTGMGRIGFRKAEEIHQALSKIQMSGAVFSGIFTHFATADERDQTRLDEQLASFQAILESLNEQPKLIHASNSAARIWHQETIFSGVRLGNALYGLNPSGQELELPYTLKPGLSLTSTLVHVKQAEKGMTIGYGATYRLSSDEWIGTVPIGYADGLTRDMQGFKVLVDGQECPIVGRVSMDQITIRLPHSYPIGTRVTLIGQEKGKQITVQDWADYRQTINYEIVCLLSDRIPRIY